MSMTPPTTPNSPPGLVCRLLLPQQFHGGVHIARLLPGVCLQQRPQQVEQSRGDDTCHVAPPKHLQGRRNLKGGLEDVKFGLAKKKGCWFLSSPQGSRAGTGPDWGVETGAKKKPQKCQLCKTKKIHFNPTMQPFSDPFLAHFLHPECQKSITVQPTGGAEKIKLGRGRGVRSWKKAAGLKKGCRLTTPPPGVRHSARRPDPHMEGRRVTIN